MQTSLWAALPASVNLHSSAPQFHHFTMQGVNFLIRKLLFVDITIALHYYIWWSPEVETKPMVEVDW